MEESLTLDELIHIHDGIQKSEYENMRFTAALKGINLDEQTGGLENDPFEKVKARVEAKLNQNTEADEFESLGIGFEEEDEDE